MIPVYICKAKNDMVIKHDKIHENEAFLLTTTKKGDKMRAVGKGFDIALTHNELRGIYDDYKKITKTFMRNRAEIRHYLKYTDLNEFVRKNDLKFTETIYKTLKGNFLRSSSNLDTLSKILDGLTNDKKNDVLSIQDSYFITRFIEDQDELKRYYKATLRRIKKYESTSLVSDKSLADYLSYLHDLGKKRVFEYLFQVLEVTI